MSNDTTGPDWRLMALGLVAGLVGGWIASWGTTISLVAAMGIIFAGGVLHGLAAPVDIHQKVHSWRT